MIHRAALAAIGVLALAACVVRPIDSGAGPADGAFDAARYVESIWNSRVLPAAAAAPAFGDAVAHSRGATLVEGEGRVLGVDSSPPGNRLLIDLVPCDGRADAAIETGPAIQGTALRDALPFIEFSHFLNQIQFAQVAAALNERVARSVVGSLRARDLPAGTLLSFRGAVASPSGGGLRRIVPVTLAVKRDKA